MDCNLSQAVIPSDYEEDMDVDDEDMNCGHNISDLDEVFQLIMNLCIHFLLLLMLQPRNKPREYWIYPRQITFWNELSSTLWLESGICGEYKFRSFYRMSAYSFEKLLQFVIPYIPQADLQTMVREPIEKIKAVAVVLFRLAHNQKCFICAEQFGLGASTVHKYTRIVVSIISTELRPNFIMTPTGERLREIMQAFEAISGVPQVAGAIDGTHIPFRVAPEKKFGVADYWCRHDFFSILLQAVCDPNLIFWDVCCDAPGGAHDTSHFYKSPLYAKLSRRRILSGPSRRLHGRRVLPYIIADSGYPTSEYMLVVKKKKRSDPQDQIVFSKHLSQARVVIENAFALLKGRWNILKDLPIRMPHAPKVVIACCVLHNYLQMENEDEFYDGHVILYGDAPLNQGETARRRDGKLLRDTVFEYMKEKNRL